MLNKLRNIRQLWEALPKPLFRSIFLKRQNAAQVFQPRSSMKDLTNEEIDGCPYQKYGRGGGKRPRFQRQNDHENSDGQRQRTLTKHVRAQYNAGDRRNHEACTFARIEDESNGTSCIPNKNRDQLTKGHNEDTATMSDDDSTIDDRVKGTRADD